MPKYLEIVVRNPIDFGDDDSFSAALPELHSELRGVTSTGRVVALFRNEKGEERGVNLDYHLSHQITNVKTPSRES